MKINWIYPMMFFVLLGGFMWAVYNIKANATTMNDIIGLSMVAAICAVGGLYTLVMAFFNRV